MAQPNLASRSTKVCIAGGGPAGMVLGFLLARAGVDVAVLEKHADFLRDFRGDTVHPSTLELMYELGLLDEFLLRPHQQLSHIGAVVDDFEVAVADFSHLPTHCKFIALMPQWDFLNFIAEKAKAYPHFHLQMEAEVTDLLRENGLRGNDRVVGVRANTPQGVIEVAADLTIGADGRRSIVREKAGLEVMDLGAPIDVLWMRVSRQPTDPNQTLGRFRTGKILVTLNRDEYWQCAYVIPKGSFDTIQQKGLPAFREDIESVAPFLRGRTDELKEWTDIKLLSVAVDRLRQWSSPGLLCIGDAAHAMSPIGGVGINLAIQDAVATANILSRPLLRNRVGGVGVGGMGEGGMKDSQLQDVQKRREFPTRVIQSLQVLAHKRLIRPAMTNRAPIQTLPLPLKLLQTFPILRRIPARLLGMGVRTEHIHSPAAN